MYFRGLLFTEPCKAAGMQRLGSTNQHSYRNNTIKERRVHGVALLSIQYDDRAPTLSYPSPHCMCTDKTFTRLCYGVYRISRGVCSHFSGTQNLKDTLCSGEFSIVTLLIWLPPHWIGVMPLCIQYGVWTQTAKWELISTNNICEFYNLATSPRKVHQACHIRAGGK